MRLSKPNKKLKKEKIPEGTRWIEFEEKLGVTYD